MYKSTIIIRIINIIVGNGCFIWHTELKKFKVQGLQETNIKRQYYHGSRQTFGDKKIPTQPETYNWYPSSFYENVKFVNLTDDFIYECLYLIFSMISIY